MIRAMIFSSLLFSSLSAAPFVEVPDKAQLSIATPSLKKRKEKKIRLENGLEALLISDPGCTQSGAALAVKVGSWDDPKDRPGMAHFVEHLLFLGTEKYPQEEGYTRYLDEHGGARNAFTAPDRTVYMFSVDNNGFSEALDRFGQFFIAPLFSPSGVEREMQAIHQEYCKNLPSDGWRVHYIRKQLSNSHHPFHNFCIGNEDTLKKISQKEVKQWYADHYSSDLMHLCVYSNESIEEIEKKVVEIFSDVKKSNFSPKTPQESLFSKHSTQNLIKVTPLHQVQKLEICWEVPLVYGEDRLVQSERLIAHILGHESTGSLLAFLKEQGLADGIEAGGYRIGRNQMIFGVTVHLTDAGVNAYEEVIHHCYSALAMIREYGIKRYLFDELVSICEMNYTYQSRKDPFQFVMDCATALCDEPLETFPRISMVPSNYSPATYKGFLNALTPENGLHILIAPQPLFTEIATQKEPWLGGTFQQVPLTHSQLDLWKQAPLNSKLSLPSPNHYLPRSFELAYKGEAQKEFPNPKLISDSEKLTLYCCPDDRFGVPEVNWSFRAHTPLLDPSSPKSMVLADLYCLAACETLKSHTYQAALGGLYFSIDASAKGFDFSINGFDDQAPLFLQTVLSGLQAAKAQETDFNRFKELARRTYYNEMHESAVRQSIQETYNILYSPYCSLKEKYAAIDSISYQEFLSYCQEVWNVCSIEGLLYGNTPLEKASEIAQILEDSFGNQALDKKSCTPLKIAQLPSKPHLLKLNSELPSNALILTMDCGAFSFEKRAAQEILSKGLEEPFFSELRTKQQTAYIVANWSREMERELYCFFAIQSSSHEGVDLLARFELFLESSLQQLTHELIPLERFEAIKASLIKKLDEPAENLKKMGNILANLTFEYEADFAWISKRKKALQEISYEQFVQYAHDFLGKINKKRLAVYVEGTLPEEQRFHYTPLLSSDDLKEKIVYTGSELIQNHKKGTTHAS